MNKKSYKKYQTLIVALSITVLVRLLFLILSKTTYENGDDQQIANYIYSYYGSYKGYVLFVNIIWETFLTKLSSLIPGIPWYGIIQLFLIECCSTVVNYLFLKKLKSRAYVPLIIFYACFGYQLFCRIQFTKTAALCSMIGLIWMFQIYKSREPYYKYLLAGLLVIIGSTIRFNAFEMGCLVVFIMGLNYLIRIRDLKELARLCIPFIVVFALVLGCRMVNRSYFSKGDLAEYRTFSALRSTVLDDGILDYEENKQAFNEMGIYEEEYNILYNWEFVDDNQYDSELFNDVKELRSEVTSFSIFTFIISAFKVLKQYILYIVASVLLYIIGRKRCKHRLLFIIETLIVVATEIYLVATGRYFINRLQLPIFLGYFLILTLFVFNTYSLKKQKLIRICLACAIGLGSISLINMKLSLRDDYKLHKQYDEIEQSFVEDEDHIYFTMGKGNLILCDIYGVYERFEKSHFDNVMKITSWDANSPSMKQRLKDLGINNFFEDIIDNSKYYLAKPGDLDTEIEYIRKHYNENAQAVLVRTIYGYNVYRIVSQNLELDQESMKDADNNYTYAIVQDEISGTIENYNNSYVYVGIENDIGEFKYYYTTVDDKGNFKGKIDTVGIVHLYLQNGNEIYRIV